MIKFLLIILFSLILSSSAYSQIVEEVGAGVIEFLLRNPKTANRMNSTETVALSIIGDLLKTKSQRKHQIQYASAGSNQVTINTNDGKQAQFVVSESGKVFLLVDGIIYPIASELVEQAKGNEKPLVNDASITKLSTIDINKLRNAYSSTLINNYNIVAIYPFKWWRDLNGDSFMNFEEIKQIKGEYFNNENFKIGIHYELPSNGKAIMIVELIDNYSGNTLYFNENWVSSENNGRWIHHNSQISAGTLPIGSYIIYVKLINPETKNTLSYKSEIIQIIEGNSSTREMSIIEKSYRDNCISYSTPKGLFFYSNYKDLNRNGLYDINEFSNLNKSSYSLSRDTLRVGINCIDKFGEIIVQSWTKEGKLLGTTTHYYQEIERNFIEPNTNPYETMDYIDMVKINGKGEYKITVDFVEGGHFEKILIMTE